MPVLVRSFVASVVALCLGSCGGDGPGRGPTDATGAAPGQSTALSLSPVRIASGGDGKPVAGAVVVIEGNRYVSDARGEVDPGSSLIPAPTGAAIDVDAPGFLPRQTRLGVDRLVVLWPVADDVEGEAVRQMVYGREGVLVPPASRGFSLQVLADDDVRAIWAAEAAAFGGPFELTYTPAFGSDPYDPDWISVDFYGEGGCDPIPAWGLCRENRPGVWFKVLPERARDPQTIRRVLASRFLGPNPLPGFMSAEAPADELSRLEVQTIGMVLKRRLPNRWPDSDR